MAGKKNSLEDWARSSDPAAGRRRCLTCAHHPKVVQATAKVLDIWAENPDKASFARLRLKLMQEFPDYKMSEGAFYNHVRNCEAARWEKITGRT